MKNKEIISTAKSNFGSLAPAFVKYTDQVLFGDCWRREDLSLRDRSLITVAALIAGQNLGQLDYHLKLAKENGLKEEELIEAITHLAFYVGWPKAASALEILKEAF
ncbi:carboxymuconolactone decarboxylase family protein [Clostridium sp. 19966]|uniref:carboxymuconolactone decarboxylase family protein n=1 Tax=Clostridium sp. 19966 TaxID=2768166 RepID=UPI0028E00D7D|nr:carboxymuconolactone decarboxylase family protein [Clostridium sp. 19966]MDT8715422.1 carboxymuconolactone decarboxylase family protein [Clostridium sp. 19966]